MMGKWHIFPMSNAAFAELLQLIFAGEIARQTGGNPADLFKIKQGLTHDQD